MDHGYGVTSQVSGTTTCKISYIWAHQRLAEIFVYSKTHSTPATCLCLAGLWHIVGAAAAAALPWFQTLQEARTRDHHALQEVGHSQRPLTEHAVTQHEQSWRAVPCSVPVHGGGTHSMPGQAWHECPALMPHVLPANSTYFCAGNFG